MLSNIGIRLSVMMFLQFFLWGAWYVTAPLFLGKIGFSGSDFGWTYSVGPIAGILSPFFVGMVADRFFATERILGVLHILGGLFMAAATLLMNPENPGSPAAINLMFFAHMLCYFPTLGLTNSLAMHNIRDSEKEFPLVRVFGTIGWIIAGIVLTWLAWGDRVEMFYLAAGLGIAQGLYCFTLPHTPPPLAGKPASARELLGAGAFVLLRNRSFLVFMVSSFLICIPLAFYYQLAARAVQQAGVADTAFKMTWGQGSEILFMVLMPFFFKRLGVKWMLIVGMSAWVARYVLFAVGAPDAIHWMLIAGILLHGICYDFFFVTGQIYTDQVAPKEIRAQAQGMLVLFTLGLGMLIGAQFGGMIEEKYTPAETHALNEQVRELGGRIAQLQGQGAAGAAGLEEEIRQLRVQESAKAMEALQLIDWRAIWLIPAGLAGLILLLFAALFRDERATAKPV